MPDIKPAVTGSGITPVMPLEPPKEAKEMTFSIDPTLIGDKGDGTTITDNKGKEIQEVKPEIKQEVEVKKEEPVKKEESKKEEKKVASVLKPPTEAKKEEVKKEEPKKEESKSTIRPITPVREKKAEQEHDAFDYTGFSPQETTNLKNMSRQSREWAAGLIKETKSLAALKDATYLQHEQGYTLSPEYQQLQNTAYFAQTEGQCWERALLQIKAGKPFKDIVGWNQDGSPKLGEEKQPSDADEVRIGANLNACLSAAQQINGQLSIYPTKFKQQIQTDLQAIKDTQKQLFAWHQDPKLLEYKVEIEGSGEKTLSQIKQDIKSMLPIYMQNNPIADVMGDLMVALRIRDAELKEARNGQTVAEIKQQEVARGEPTSDHAIVENKKTTINGKPIPESFDLVGFPSR